MEKKDRLRRGLSKFLNFVCALIIMFAVLFAIGAFIEADFRAQSIAGNHDTPIFSYVRHDDNRAELSAFGESVTINLDRLDAAVDTLGEISAVNQAYAPAFINLSGAIIRGCISAVAGGFMRIPGIVSYFMGR